jgi:large subunit ribosomal protein L4
MSGEQIGEVELSAAVFGIAPNMPAVHAAVKNHLANRRQGTQSALTRGEVSGGGKKPWRQKGTGRARQGSTRAPQWIHGGIVFAPKPRDYSYRINRSLRRLALRSALSAKAASGDLLVVDNLNMDEIKTKTLSAFLDKVAAGKSILVMPEVRENVVKSARNLPGVLTTVAPILSVYDIVNAKRLIVDKAALAVIEEVFA